jgi:hypothetical protein
MIKAESLAPARQRREIRHWQAKSEPGHEGSDKTLRLAKRLSEHRGEGEADFNRQVRICGLPTAALAPFVRSMLCNARFEPDREIAPHPHGLIGHCQVDWGI